jgi:hypothetical protein
MGGIRCVAVFANTINRLSHRAPASAGIVQHRGSALQQQGRQKTGYLFRQTESIFKYMINIDNYHGALRKYRLIPAGHFANVKPSRVAFRSITRNTAKRGVVHPSTPARPQSDPLRSVQWSLEAAMAA